jgi:ParB/RepB/Spo0J family partition protein
MKSRQKHKLLDVPMQNLVMLKRNPQYLTPSQMDSLKTSIRRDGFCVPLLVRKISGGRFSIVSGNHRYMASKELGLSKVACVVTSMSDGDAKRLAVNLNTIHGDPNVELLAPFLAEMNDETLSQIHLEDDIMLELQEFDKHLADRLSQLEPPDSINRDSVGARNTKSGVCICPKCGKGHLKP